MAFFIYSFFTILSGCAGPNTPFGSLHRPHKGVAHRGPASAELPKALSIDFSPEAQIYHKNFDLTIHVQDQRGIESIKQIKLYYNGREVQRIGFQKIKWDLSKGPTKAVLRIPSLKLPSHLKHNLSVRYKRGSKTYEKKLKKPQCQISKGAINLKRSAELIQNDHMIKMIELLAKKQNLSPRFIIALAAQQSGLDSHYVGAEQRLGLMQIKTSEALPLADHKDQKNWSSYPEIDQESRIGLYVKVMLGLINEKNEWRLDPEKSLLVGMQYLKNLQHFWRNSSSYQRQDLILASYYLGPDKVSKIHKAMGANWKESDELSAVLPKIREVKAHCFELSVASL